MNCPVKLLLLCLCAIMFPSAALSAGTCRVLVVMSYEEDYPWVKQQKEGIDSVLGDSCELKYYYLNSKHNFEGTRGRGKDAYALYESFRPDGVIAADDDAQSLFVVPYLRNKVATPVMFCGVNAEPEKYGFPAGNVSGILERHHIAESIVLARQLIPSVKTIGFMMKESPVAEYVRAQVAQEAASFPLKIVGFKTPKTLQEAVELARQFRKSADLLYLETLEGIRDESGNPVKDCEAFPLVAQAFGKGTLTGNTYYVEYGLLAAVILSGKEQGATAARMLRRAMDGTPVAKIPIVKNHDGKRMINVTVMRKLGITPVPLALRGVELVRTREP
jgi:hypothetical protein